MKNKYLEFFRIFRKKRIILDSHRTLEAMETQLFGLIMGAKHRAVTDSRCHKQNVPRPHPSKLRHKRFRHSFSASNQSLLLEGIPRFSGFYKDCFHCYFVSRRKMAISFWTSFLGLTFCKLYSIFSRPLIFFKIPSRLENVFMKYPFSSRRDRLKSLSKQIIGSLVAIRLTSLPLDSELDLFGSMAASPRAMK